MTWWQARKEEAKKRMEAQKESKEPADRSEEVPEDYKQEVPFGALTELDGPRCGHEAASGMSFEG